jgi:CRISPR-associated protein Cas2
MFVVVSYDIQKDKNRRLIQKTLEGFGERVQYSVFECSISEAQYRELKEKLVLIMDGDTDSIRCYRLCSACCKKVEYQGNGKIMEDDYFFMV